MKKLENKETAITMNINNEKINLGFFKLCVISLGATPVGGATTALMRKRFSLIDKIEAAEKEIEITDEDLDLLIQASGINWVFMHKDLISFEDYLQSLK